MKLILHIGLGKTGTTAFQRFCDVNQRVLADSGYLFGGVYLQNAAPGLFEGQGQVTRPQELEPGLKELDRTLLDSPRRFRAMVWSNEAFSMAREPDDLVRTFDEYVDASRVFDSWECYLVVRRQDQWIESAYKQWAMKHKTNRGRRIMEPREYVDSVGYLLDYDDLVSRWRRSSAVVHACSYDAVMDAGGIVDYLLRRMGMDLPPERLVDPGRVHESLDNDLSMLVALHNQGFESANDPQDLLRAIQDSGATKNLLPAESAFVPHRLKQEIFDRYAASNERLQAEHFEHGEHFNQRPVEDRPPYEPDPIQLLSRVLPILANQQRRLERQNNRIAKLERDMKGSTQP